jgi:hypothetical protein
MIRVKYKKDFDRFLVIDLFYSLSLLINEITTIHLVNIYTRNKSYFHSFIIKETDVRTKIIMNNNLYFKN